MSIIVFLIITALTTPINALPVLSSNDTREPNHLTDTNYIVTEHCGDKVPQVDKVVDEARWLARVAHANALLWDVDSIFGFKAMFKESEARETVLSILDSIHYCKGKTNLRPRPGIQSIPRLSCVTEDSVNLYKYLNLDYDPWQRCLVAGPDSTRAEAFYAEGTVYTFLCPAFFTQAAMVSGKHCPSVTNNKFSGDSGIFYRNYQTYTMLYQLIRFYLGNDALSSDTDPKEQLDWNNCVGLNMLNSVLNPTNLEIYIACKLSISCSVCLSNDNRCM